MFVLRTNLRQLIDKIPLYNITSKCHASTVPINLSTFGEHKSLVVEQFGDPTDNVILKTRKPEEVLPKDLNSRQVIIKHLAAPINPADINLIQGVYGVRPKPPCVVGNEGVARVVSVGSEVSHLKPGDLVIGILLTENWQSYSVQDKDALYKLDNNLEITTAAQLKVNPCTAYRMLKDFHKLKKGDCFIQNGANSAVGVYAIQLAKLWGYKSINVIRDRPNKEDVIKELKDYGADLVLTEEEVGNVELMKPILSDIGKPKIFLNCVGGKNAINCQKTLEQDGYSITYGAMSRQPFSVTATSLIFKDHKYVGFWVSRWYKEREQSGRRKEIEEMLSEIGDMFVRGVLKPKSSRLISFEERQLAFNSEFANTKFVFSINK